MPDNTPRLYEGLFLATQSAISAGLDQTLDLIRDMLTRAEAEVVTLNKWDDRKLAFTMDGQKRGTYIITHFRVAPFQIANIERDCNLSEDIIRVLFTRCDHFGETEISTAIESANDASVLEDSTPSAEPAATEA